MPSNKKRKLDGSSEALPVSAFAARKSLQNQTSRRSTPLSSNQSQASSLASIPASPVTAVPLDCAPEETTSPSLRPVVAASQRASSSIGLGNVEDDTDLSLQSHAEPPELLLETSLITLSTFKPSKETVEELKDGTLHLKLAPGERLVILGQCELSVQQGQITLLGATLQPSETRHNISVPLSHSLPVIRCLATDLNPAEISLHQGETGLEHLKSLSPLFGRLWNDSTRPGNGNKDIPRPARSSFRILFSSDDAPKGAYLQPIISAPEWNEALSKLSNPSELALPRILVCGPKSSGKSTFTKLLSNRLLSTAVERTATFPKQFGTLSGIVILDLDPGQPEYSVPGQLSLLHIQEPNFGPPFAHPIPDCNGRIIRAHSIAAITPSTDPSLYMACALDLFVHHRNLLSDMPLIINTPGWVLGTGLEILVDLITNFRPTEVVYMSQEGPWEVVESLREAAKAAPVFTLPSQASKYVTKTATHLRTMQSMSYFHTTTADTRKLTWSAQPLSSVPPWEIRYSGDHAGILGVMCYGEQPPPDLLLESINGSLLAVVVLDDMAAIPGWRMQEGQTIKEEVESRSDQPYAKGTADTELRRLNEGSLPPQRLSNPLIVRTPEDIPYFNPANTISLNPKYSHCVGLALVRGFDISRRRLQVITPISAVVISEINESGKPIVLISGKLDTPGWAFMEEMVQKRSLERVVHAQDEDDVVIDQAEDESDGDDDGQERTPLRESFYNAPWVERQEGSQGRAVGSRVWRVRRDLGKFGD